MKVIGYEKSIFPFCDHLHGDCDIFLIVFLPPSSLRGENGIDGKDGAEGKDGETPYIGDNGNWFIGNTDTGIPAHGEDGRSPSVSINSDGYWVIDSTVTAYRADGNTEKLLNTLKSVFDLRENQFICEYETLQNPFWSYTNSTFSGWGGSSSACEEKQTDFRYAQTKGSLREEGYVAACQYT